MRALIVEDNESLSFMWSDVLSDIGFETVCVTSAQAAMGYVLKKPFDIFIIDLFVDDGPTVTLSDWMSLRCPDTPILMLTGSNAMPMGEHSHIAKGVSWMLRKPVDIKELTQYVTYLVETSKNSLTASQS